MNLALKMKESAEQKYLNIIGSCFSNYNDRLRIISRSYENGVIRIIVEIIDDNDIEFIYLRNATFFSCNELIEILMNKLKKIVSTHFLKVKC